MKYANFCGYSDVEPYEIIRKVSDKCYEIRAMDAVKDPAVVTQFVVGGFSAVSDNAQKWIISSNSENEIIRIRANKKKGFANKYGQRFSLSDKPCKYYDYNF